MRTETLSESGRPTSPTEARRAQALEGETALEVEVDADNDAVILRPAVVLRREDARVRQLDEDGLKKPAG